MDHDSRHELREEERRDKLTFMCTSCMHHFLGEDVTFYDDSTIECYLCSKESSHDKES